MRRHSKGMTLIELMVTVAIVGILASIAYPAYVKHLIKARRADAEGVLMSFANTMERHFTESGTYLAAAAGGADTGAPAVFPTQAPLDGGDKYYDLTINAATATTYTLRATPIAGTPQASDGYLELTQSGARAWDKNNNGTTDSGENTW